MKRTLKILRVSALASLALAVLKLGGFTLTINDTVIHFAAMPWRWVMVPIALPAGMLATTAITIVALFYHRKNTKQ